MMGNLNNYLVLAEKIFGVLGAIIYLIFALVIVKQVGTMSKNIKDKFNGLLIIFSYIHLAAAVLLVFIAWTVL
ncbi:MAG TPA: DUF5657 family protein [Candidatus Methanoperedens sp.]|nr:DUF5657 family protein [Candidatus Methanoperedens sp.]